MKFPALTALAFLFLAACTSQKDAWDNPEQMGSEMIPKEETVAEEWAPPSEARAPSAASWVALCYDHKASRSLTPLLSFTVLGPRKISDLFVEADAARFEGYLFPKQGQNEGPFFGREISDHSTYNGAVEYEPTSDFRLILPELSESLGGAHIGDARMRNQNAVAQVSVRGSDRKAFLRMHCERQQIMRPR